VTGSMPAGEYRVIWDGRNGAGDRVAPGIYFCRLQAGGDAQTQRLVVVR